MAAEKENKNELIPDAQQEEKGKITGLSGMFRNWFLDYASYVILERAVPNMADGFKPVQRRILHSMKELEDGRYNKVANIIGNTMKYHPHGDASIGDALVQLGQKELLIDMQGNWGNILTGDSAAAPRYIEARLSKFALDVVFNPKTTKWIHSYDGRNREPDFLPVKFPMLLAQGSEGIAVGLSTKILPHNFIELIDACIAVLKNESFVLYPDFPTAGLVDVRNYNKGERGGKVRVRARMSSPDKKSLVITEIPFSTTTSSLIDSIVNANEKGKIKVRKIEDNTAANVEIVVHLAPGVSPDQTIDALYAFTDCEISISPLCCVIQDNAPRFIHIDELLIESTHHTRDLLKLELEIEMQELLEHHLYSSLEKIFIEKRIYRDIEECTTWESVLETIDKGLKPYKKKFYREITMDDVARLTEIKIKRISKFDAFKADEIIKGLEDQIKKVQDRLDNLIEYCIAYFRDIKKKYSKGRERKTEIRAFDNIQAAAVAIANQKLYVDREEGFAGFGLKKMEYVTECSELDDIIAFTQDGTCIVTKVADKVFLGKNIIHIDVFKKNDERTIYNAIYRDGATGTTYVKRFYVKGITRDKEYNLTQGTPHSKVLYFTANPNGEAEVISVYLVPRPKLKKLVFDFDFSELSIKGRASIGNQLTRFMIRKIKLKDEGKSTLGGIKYWYDKEILRLTTEERGQYLGAFHHNDTLLFLMKSGYYRIAKPDMQMHFDEDIMHIEKFNPLRVFTVLYKNTDKEWYLKRFQVEQGPGEKTVEFMDEGDQIEWISTEYFPVITVFYDSKKLKKPKDPEEIDVAEFAVIRGIKAKGKKISTVPLKKFSVNDPKPTTDKMIRELLGLAEDQPTNSSDGAETEEGLDGQITLSL
ncbi:MAG: DNA topoisomerase IV [Bacteroidetes bacterium GWF2_43_63]|nr:MAG: DNA topoisomerase IV [Bacteroidetes bacterium GWE2_42_42]OFY53431.1 MAG: DNA topoisomerase IV [Bacteroidetes bacterium GWF2_43_63]HBG69395.1 DNA gyrase/topoisomerase IV subunit A [Bacteroidales bacterium]HCB62014.1 DNA gyrase/topoisomerase IV subunit A [Bacteroidales bacterium]HCY23150.1 DNA gyrase/topoisomerase IV subunit A [Bacteroidales bacterium]